MLGKREKNAFLQQTCKTLFLQYQIIIPDSNILYQIVLLYSNIKNTRELSSLTLLVISNARFLSNVSNNDFLEMFLRKYFGGEY